ncbi:hypothetical protein LJR290_007220 [Variovorax sp. LjRoot290]
MNFKPSTADGVHGCLPPITAMQRTHATGWWVCKSTRPSTCPDHPPRRDRVDQSKRDSGLFGLRPECDAFGAHDLRVRHAERRLVVRRRALLHQAAVAFAQDVAAPGRLGERGSGLAAQLALLHGPEIALLLLGGKKS